MPKGTLVFVHGTGVRGSGYVDLRDTVAKQVEKHLPGVTFVSSDWGDHHGVSLAGLRKCLPPWQRTKGVTLEPPMDDEVALWAQLLEDPLFELRLGGEARSGASTGEVIVNRLHPGETLSDRLKRISLDNVDLSGTGVSADDVRRAIAQVAASDELPRAAEAAGDAADPDLARAVARATIAVVIRTRRESAPNAGLRLATDAAMRDRVTAGLKGAMSASTKGFGDGIRKRAVEYAMKKATSVIKDQRSELTGAALPGVGDILHYLRRGTTIATYVRQAFASASPPVVAVGHSLGGIILVDLLSGPSPPNVDLLVTVGSQSPLFYLIDSLEHVRAEPAATSVHFHTPWRNIYDPNDFLAYCTQPLLEGHGDIKDYWIDSKVPFPDSHGAYWHNDETYERVLSWWPQ